MAITTKPLTRVFNYNGLKLPDLAPGLSVETVKEKARQVKEYGVDGVKNDVVNYTRQKPLAALLIAGAVGAVAALLLRRK